MYLSQVPAIHAKLPISATNFLKLDPRALRWRSLLCHLILPRIFANFVSASTCRTLI